MNRLPALLAAAVLAVSLPASASRAFPATVEQPRPYGYVIGDLLIQRIRLEADGRRFVPAELPRLGRVGMSLWRREVRQEQDDEGVHWLVVQYQVINTPPSLAAWELPALELKPADGDAGHVTLSAPAWPFSVAPITPRQAFGKGDLTALRADQEPQGIAVAPLDRRLRDLSAMLGLVLLAWGAYAWWRHWKTGRELPFARAARDLRKLPDNSPAAWQRLQRALNEAAGEVVRAGTLDRLIGRAPYLAAERATLERYCRETSALFFGGALPADAVSAHRLADRLMRIERWHAR